MIELLFIICACLVIITGILNYYYYETKPECVKEYYVTFLCSICFLSGLIIICIIMYS